jgi:charged multivesicular body protein 1
MAKIYAANAIRKKNEAVNLLRLSSRVDAAAARVQTAVTMRQVTNNMVGVVKGMDRALESMNLETITLVMEKFERQFEDLDVQGESMDVAISGTAILNTPQDEVDLLIQQVADEAKLELSHELGAVVPAQGLPSIPTKEPQELAERLAKLRNG